jgi:8-oxo-dGTP pyrophosphatase MutT (NUDIX family)
MSDEMYPIVDEKDQVKEVVFSKEKLHDSKLFHRCVHVFIEVFGGLFLLQKKADKPEIENAGKWSSAVSGHVIYNESYEQAAIREAFEELGLVISKCELKKITKVYPTEEYGFEFVTLFTYLLDPSTEFPKTTDEVDEILIAPLKMVTQDIEKYPEKYSRPFRALFKIFLGFEKNSTVLIKGGTESDVLCLSNYAGL